MSFIVAVPENVAEELDSIFTYYEELQPGLGIKFLDDWENTMDLLEKRPFIHQLQVKNFRTIQFNHFPFLVVFEVLERSIVLYRVIHCRQNPAKRYRIYRKRK